MRRKRRTPGWTPPTEMAASKEKDANTTVTAGPGGEIFTFSLHAFTNARQEHWKTIKEVFFYLKDRALRKRMKESITMTHWFKFELLFCCCFFLFKWFWFKWWRLSFLTAQRNSFRAWQTLISMFYLSGRETQTWGIPHCVIRIFSPTPWKQNSPSHTENNFQAS